MKKRIYILLVLLTGALTAQAQDLLKSLQVDNLNIEKAGDQAVIRFEGMFDKKGIGRNATLLLMPVITDGTYKVSFSSVAVQSKRASVLANRRINASGETSEIKGVQTVPPGKGFTYHSYIDFQPWMHGARIEFESLWMGCCNTVEGSMLLASNILPQPEPEPGIPEIAEGAAGPEIVETTGQMVERTFSFVFPASEFDPDNLVVYDEDRENAMIVYYLVNESVIRAEYVDNAQTLKNLEAAIRVIDESSDSRVAHVVIAGFASPEGSFQVNDRLAHNRSIAVRDYILSKTKIDKDIIIPHNGSADWRGLTLLIENSDMPSKEKVLEIIRTVPVWDARAQKGRMGELMRLDGARPYTYMKEHFFPLLRNGAFIRVYYEDIK